MGRPDTTRALTAAFGPGITVRGIFFLIHSLITLNPGSCMAGIPDSETRAISSPFSSSSII
ncbi:MAG: hypothetical protein AVO38_00390 [delta proteobacterium ML8_D]|nr:MAG: hypothetical protein AVO38_00390 [delta proteobacterium ML8_D]